MNINVNIHECDYDYDYDYDYVGLIDGYQFIMTRLDFLEINKFALTPNQKTLIKNSY